jgi:serine/threonine protein kinase
VAWARIAQGPIPLEEALPIARQIAEALEAAHEQGIMHRDLKPANVKVRPDGTVKVLDFGLAKAMEPATAMSPGLSQSPTITTPAMTQMGVILGTAAYMAPEQAKGKPLDKRNDIWAFGCVLYEMLTGTRAFEGDDVSDMLATVLKGEPDWDLLPRELSPVLLTYLRRCLHKEPRQRIHDIADVRLALEGVFDSSVPARATALAHREGRLSRPLSPIRSSPYTKAWPLTSSRLSASSSAASGDRLARNRIHVEVSTRTIMPPSLERPAAFTPASTLAYAWLDPRRTRSRS